MLRLEDFMTIQALVKRGVYLRHCRAARGASEDGEPAPRRGPRGSLLDPYRSVIDGLLAKERGGDQVGPTHESGDTNVGEQGTAYFGVFRTLHFGLDTALPRSDRIGLGRSGSRRLCVARRHPR